jgi:Phosphotransferase enzyme family
MPNQAYPLLTEAAARAALVDAELGLSLEPMCVEAREDRWLVSLPGDHLAWFPASPRGRERLAGERRVLRLLERRCAFQVPRVLFESPDGWDVRAAVPGVCDPWGLYRRTLTDTTLAESIGRAIGQILIDQHTHVSYNDVALWLPIGPQWPEPTDWIRQRLPEVVNDRDLLARIDGTLDAYEQVVIAADDNVLVHADLGLHNIAVDPGTAQVLGVFDYDGAAWADRHHDFRYLLFHHERDEALESALAVYEPAAGRVLSRHRIRLYNAVCAISFVAYRRGVPAEERSCGRTLAEDLRWVRGALARL